MKTVWKIIKYGLIIVVVLFLLLLASLIPDYVYFMPKAKPPQNVTNLQTFFEWKPKPMGAFKVTASNTTCYQLLGPAGRSLPSGPAAYSFDSNGNFIGWTSDNGDFFTPQVVYAPGAIHERISVDDVRAMMKTNAVVKP